MRNTIFGMLIIALLIFFNACTPGETRIKLTGNERDLPSELKGLKVYQVDTGDGTAIYVAILDDQILSTSRHAGRQSQNLVNIKERTYTYKSSDIISENDSIVVIKK